MFTVKTKGDIVDYVFNNLKDAYETVCEIALNGYEAAILDNKNGFVMFIALPALNEEEE
jgi:hypothetical protein